jgi:hypothetical protein
MAAADAMSRAVEGMTMAQVIEGATIMLTTAIGAIRIEHNNTPEQTELLFETIYKDMRAALVARGHLPARLSH